jgi:hypothetical protein
MDNRNTISNTLQSMIDEIINENPRTQRQYNRRNVYDNDNLAIIQLLREILHSHDDRMREYSENMRIILQILSLLVQRQYYSRTYTDPLHDYYTNSRENVNNQTNNIPQANRTNVNRRNENQRTNSSTRDNYQSQILSYVIYPFLDLSGSILNQSRLQDVIVRPTEEQINNATRIITYDHSIEFINHRCPISLADFEEGEDVRQLIYCGHCFCEESIQNWFNTNVRCPVCRYDIREYSLPNIHDISSNTPTRSNSPSTPNNRNRTTNNINNINNSMNNLNYIFDGISTNLTNILNNYLDNEMDMSNELTYTFEFPIIHNDLSRNNIMN